MTLSPRLDVLPAAQRALWPELAAVPQPFVLYGGTGLALRLGHRESIDFDFFSHDPLDHRDLEALSVFGGLRFGRVGEPDVTDDGVLRVASVLDL